MSLTSKLFKGVGRLSTEVLNKGQGAWVTAASGTKFLDFTSGIGVTNTGHCHPHVVKAIQDQAATMLHAQCGVALHDKMLTLADRLVPLLPEGLDRVFFATTGAEAVENSIKLARQATGKPNVIVFKGSYHGRSLGTMPLTTSKSVYRSKFGPFMGGIFVAPFAWSEAGVPYALEELRQLLKQQTTPDETCAVLIEPVLGEGGYVPAPPGFLQGIRDICDENDILFISDEVQTGFGRTGKLFATDGHYGVTPDILIMAKGLASGVPISAIASTTELTERQPPGSMGGTYAGNILACASALATIDVMEQEQLPKNAATLGDHLQRKLNVIKDSGKYPIKDVRGLGLMVGLEFDAEFTKNEIDLGVDIFTKALDDTFAVPTLRGSGATKMI
eukprot:gene1589-16485_t